MADATTDVSSLADRLVAAALRVREDYAVKLDAEAREWSDPSRGRDCAAVCRMVIVKVQHR